MSQIGVISVEDWAFGLTPIRRSTTSENLIAPMRAGRLDDHGDEEATQRGAGCAERLMTADRLLAEGKDMAAAVCCELGVSEQTYHRWRNQFGSQGLSTALQSWSHSALEK